MINRKDFYDNYKIEFPQFGGMNQKQVDGINAVLDLWKNGFINNSDCRHLAYILATIYHETGSRMYGIDEFGKGKGKRYGRNQKYNGQAYTNYNHTYYGRGMIQLTWYENYSKFGRLIGADLLGNPDLANDNDIGAKIALLGMERGLFTGVSLKTYTKGSNFDSINARRIINGTDRAEIVKGHYEKFLKIIQNS